MNYDLVKIKEKYGEKMMHLCRTLFPTLLENEGQLFNLLESNFAYSKFLYEDIVNNLLENKFKNYIYSLLEVEEKDTEVIKTPRELLDDAGYNLYECNTESDISAFIKYYRRGERLCTFNGGRLNSCHVFFAVKKNVDEIKRENFLHPERQDEYRTSVISIQFKRGKNNTLSIKNRYNHKVVNPDATFSNNLDNIIEGLTKSFEKEYHLNINKNSSKDFELPGYVKASDGKFYKYNYEINNIYYCTDNIIIDNFNVVNTYQEKEKYLIIDYFIVDLVNKKISLYDETISDSFIDGLQNIKRIEIRKNTETKNKVLTIIFEDDTNAVIEINKYNTMISYSNKNIWNIGNKFLSKNEYLEKLVLSGVVYIGERFLEWNKVLNEIHIPNVIEIEDNFLVQNSSLKEINIPNVLEIGNNFLRNNNLIQTINFPNLLEVGHDFLYTNNRIRIIDLPSLIKVGNSFFKNNRDLISLNMCSLCRIGDDFLHWNKAIKSINLPNLTSAGGYFLYFNNSLLELNLENLENIGSEFLYSNRQIKNLNLPKVKCIGQKFLYSNNALTKLYMPELCRVGGYFMYNKN